MVSSLVVSVLVEVCDQHPAQVVVRRHRLVVLPVFARREVARAAVAYP